MEASVSSYTGLAKSRIEKQIDTALAILSVDDFCVYNFHSLIADTVHPADPFHRIGGFQRLRDAFRFSHLLYQPREHLLCLPVNVSKITVQLADGEQSGIQRLAVALEIASMPLSLDADMCHFFLRQFQTGQIVVPLQLIPKSILFVVDVLLHFVILQYD